MAKRMPLPPAAEGVSPGFCGVVSRMPVDSRPESPRLQVVEDEAVAASLPLASEVPTGDVETVNSKQVEEQPSDVEKWIPVDAIDRSPYQPRLKTDEESLARLSHAIGSEGQINAIVVRRKADGRYELIGGERRWLAVRMLKQEHIRAVVKEVENADAAVMALTDNEARDDLSDYERARAYKQLLDSGVVDSQVQLALRIGRERTFVVRCMAFFRLPQEVLKMLDERPGLLGASKAANFATMMDARDGRAEGCDADLIIEAIRKVYDGKLDVANALNWVKGQIRARYSSAPQAQTQTWHAGERRLGEFKIDGRRLVIHCADGVTPDELINRILQKTLEQ